MCYFHFVPSKGEINQSGELLRQVRLNPTQFSFTAQQAAIQVVEDFRKGFSYPLSKVNSGLRAMVAQVTSDVLVAQRLKRMPQIIRSRNYVQTPKASGYRAIHLVAERDDHRIEVQLRTKGQQAWANVVEKVAATYQIPLKDEIGPDEVMDWLLLAAEGIAYKDRGEAIPADLKADISSTSEIAFVWMEAEEAK